jgi:hypothetical protein
MSWGELNARARQEVAKRTDLLLSRMGARFVDAPGASSHERCGHFFFKAADIAPILDFLRLQLPDVVDEIIHQAEQICRHRFDLLGYRNVNYGARIDWHLDAVNGRRAPQRAWYNIPYLDFGQVGDSKVIWELNRHQHLVTLAKAYRLTERPQFALELFEQWYDWQQQNPFPIGINWASSLEVAFRTLSWLWISRLLHGCSVVPARFSSDLHRALMLNGRHIARFPSTYFSPNTHLLGEGVGLFFIGTLCPGSRLARSWQRDGWRIVLQEARRQILPDGMHFEHSTHYHAYALDFFLHARVLARLNGIPIPPAFDKRIAKMVEVICCLSRSGRPQRMGDDDGGRVFDPRRNRLEHLVDPLTLGAILFNRDDFKTAASNLTEESIWLLGVEAGRQFEDLPGNSGKRASFALEHSGIHVMASSEPAAHEFVIDAGPQEPGRQGHRHADVLSVQLNIKGHDVLTDPGTFAYVGQDGERDFFRGTGAHNSVQVDGLSQGEPGGPFEWRGLPRAHVNHWVVGNTFDFFEGSHRGYRRLPDRVEHRRFIFYLKPHFWLVRDVVSGADVHEVAVHWHFSKGHLTVEGNGVGFLSDSQTALALTFGSSRKWSHDMCTGWHSPEYGKKEAAPVLRSTINALLPVELATLLIPISTTAAKLGVLEPLTESTGPSVRAYRYTAADQIEHLFVFADAAEEWSIGPCSSDARFLFCTPGDGRKPNRFVLCDGTYLAVGGREILAAEKCLKHAEFCLDSDRPQFSCSNLEAVHINPAAEAGSRSSLGALAAV